MAKLKNEYLYAKNTFYHIYNRGNNKQLIFLDTKDYLRFVGVLLRYEELYDISLYAYCLMPNHYHLLLRLGSDENAISEYMHRCMTAYVMYFNKKHSRIGRLFQSPFQVRRIYTVKGILRVIQYIEKNPVKADLVKVSSDYRWLYISLKQQKREF